MKYLHLFALALSSLLVSSCDQSDRQKQASHFSLSNEIIWSHHWAELRKIRIDGTGVRQISLGEGLGGRKGVDLSEDQVEVVIMVMIDPGFETLTWWVTEHSRKDGKHVSGGAGAPQSFKITNGKYLKDVVAFADLSGEQQYGNEITLFTFKDPAAERESVSLTVQ